ncbi:hypothetical protein V7122_10820 [Bacillus sp. JJ1532]
MADKLPKLADKQVELADKPLKLADKHEGIQKSAQFDLIKPNFYSNVVV